MYCALISWVSSEYKISTNSSSLTDRCDALRTLTTPHASCQYHNQYENYRRFKAIDSFQFDMCTLHNIVASYLVTRFAVEILFVFVNVNVHLSFVHIPLRWVDWVLCTRSYNQSINIRLLMACQNAGHEHCTIIQYTMLYNDKTTEKSNSNALTICI